MLPQINLLPMYHTNWSILNQWQLLYRYSMKVALQTVSRMYIPVILYATEQVQTT